jgi:transposase
VQRQREDFARKTANALVTSHDLVGYEHLQIRNILRNRKIAKSIYDAGWGTFLRWVRYYGVLERDHNAALNILAKALKKMDGTLGHRETAASRNQDPPVIHAGEC